MIGLGMIGQMSAQAARRAGARVIATDLIAARVRARRRSTRPIVSSTARRESLEDAVREEAPDGADVVIDTTGITSMYDRCRDLIRHEGKIMMQGYYADPISIEFHPTHLTRATVTFPCGWDDEFNDELAEDMATGRIAIEPAHHAPDPVPGRGGARTTSCSTTPSARSAWCSDWTGA